jgi:Domain of unknown function (DUF4260)
MPQLDPVIQRRIEAVAILAVAIFAYTALGYSWGFFASCFFLPDLSILAYLVSRRFGAVAYNLAHFYLWPILFGVIGQLTDSSTANQVALIWAAHVAFDRAIGWGLKYEQSFCHTDMGVKSLPIAPSWLLPEGGA